MFATASAAVAAAVEQMMEDERAAETALGAMADEIRARVASPRDSFIGIEEAFADARRRTRTEEEA
ncbi:MAG: hypothetical protein R3D25_18040 [Geminicoccaceae bacterium]